MTTVVGKTCPYCQAPIKPGAPAVVCSACAMPHHADCWQENGRCTTFGCDGTSAGVPQGQSIPPANISHTETPVRRPVKPGSIFVWVFGIIALLLLIWAVDSSLNSHDGSKTAAPLGPDAGEERTNATDGATMILIPVGEFLMGSSDNDKLAGPEEKPQHSVYLDAYYIYKNDVTVAEYRTFCTATGRVMPAAPPWGWIDTHPIVNVSWDDAKAYADWAGASLPTEAQWEKAARGTDGRIYPWGNEWDAAKCSNAATTTSPVGSFPASASPYGCLDMAGNVGQWCADWYGADYYQHTPSRNPTGPETGAARVLRGGSWNNNTSGIFHIPFRGNSDPADSSNNNGFRCVLRSPEP